MTSPPDHPADRTRQVERKASQKMLHDTPHPVAAAVAAEARAQLGLSQQHFADTHGLSIDHVVGIEAGQVPWEQLPSVIGDILAEGGPIDLLALADLDTQLRLAAEGPSAGNE
jgi:hypothetical protein